MVRRIALEAGEITLRYFEDIEPSHAEEKADGSPVTIADQETEALITERLAALTPGVPVVGEESVALGTAPDPHGHEYFWLVDALDGTKEFISGGGDFTVNIALIRTGVPVLGVVYAPACGELYTGCGAGTAVRWLEETGKDKEIHVRTPPKDGLTVVASRRHGDDKRLDRFLAEFKIEKLIKRGSSLKLCAVACGKADIYPRLGPTSEWDTAAGDAVLRAAGGILTDLDGKPLLYGGARPKFRNPEFVACSFKWFEATD
ncbi:MAG: 3'(2'),5'-bisphosphate nucleotidase CysQ [Alphaproteobacteria bacterium]|nr:3'(2'),5'-bisphosphate nucleotidase CysQ [Alphaproteobacteria bacterium]